MSEYQYYEFAAIDGPISDEGLLYARGCSSRASVSRVRWQNTYNFGSFHGSVDALLKYYDAHFYIANWGTVALGLAFSIDAISPTAIQPYFRNGKPYKDTLTVKDAANRLVVWWKRSKEDAWDWTGGEGIMDQLIGIREELMRGDYRALFLGWLADFNLDESQNPEAGAMSMPPIPAGLDRLSSAQTALIKHFPVDIDALAAAAGMPQTSGPDRIPMAEVLERLSASDMRVMLARVAEGGGTGVMADLNRRAQPPVEAPLSQAMRCADFGAKAIQIRRARLRQEAEAAAADRKRKEEERRRHLASILQRADTLWRELDALMDQKISSAYEQAANQLQELRDAYDQAADLDGFQKKLAAFRLRYSRRSSMLRRIEKL